MVTIHFHKLLLHLNNKDVNFVLLLRSMSAIKFWINYSENVVRNFVFTNTVSLIMGGHIKVTYGDPNFCEVSMGGRTVRTCGVGLRHASPRHFKAFK